MSGKKIIFIIPVLIAILITTGYSYADNCADEKKANPRNEMPPEYKTLKNPMADTPENLASGKKLYTTDAKPAPCVRCHGESGKGDGAMGKYLKPKPRNFTCKDFMANLSDGELFWITRNGVIGAGMAPFPEKLVSDEDMFKIILYIRSFAK